MENSWWVLRVPKTNRTAPFADPGVPRADSFHDSGSEPSTGSNDPTAMAGGTGQGASTPSNICPTTSKSKDSVAQESNSAPYFCITPSHPKIDQHRQ
jgi:hypothetical protein